MAADSPFSDLFLHLAEDTPSGPIPEQQEQHWHTFFCRDSQTKNQGREISRVLAADHAETQTSKVIENKTHLPALAKPFCSPWARYSDSLAVRCTALSWVRAARIFRASDVLDAICLQLDRA